MMNKVVTIFLCQNGKILLLKRSQLVGTQQGKWSGVSGYLEGNDPLDQAYTEILEETSLSRSDVILISKGNYLDFPDSRIENKIWRVYPFLFQVVTPEKIVLDWEHDEMQWIEPGQLIEFETVPDLNLALKEVLIF